MSSRLPKKINKTDIILVIIVLFLIIVTLILYLKNIVIPKQNKEKTYQLATVISKEEKENQQVSVPQTDEEITKYLSTLGERDRMQYYCGEYIKHLKHKEYEQAYNMLYTEFKQNYFPTIEEYEEYVKKFYPEYFALQYDDITRQGDIYVLRLKIIDAMNSEKSEEENIQRVVIKEYNYNDFVISFQVK